MLLFEGGKSLDINEEVTNDAIEGTKRFLDHLDMLNPRKKANIKSKKPIYIEKSNWVRAKYSGMFHGMVKIGSFIKKGELIATISDPYEKVEHKMKAPHDGYVINVNDAPIVYQGDAIFHVSTHLESES